MNVDIPRNTYSGPNLSHTRFSLQYRYLNALYYLVVSNKKVLADNLKSASQTPDSLIGVVTNAISNMQFQGVFVPANDARNMADDFSGFLDVLNRQTISSSYRALSDYLIDQLIELRDVAGAQYEDKISVRLEERFLTLEHIIEAYKQIGFELYSEQEDSNRMNWLVATRNVIEHNDSKVNKEYLRLTGNKNLSIGDVAPSGMKEAGEALSLVEHIAQSSNQRVLSRWPILAR